MNSQTPSLQELARCLEKSSIVDSQFQLMATWADSNVYGSTLQSDYIYKEYLGLPLAAVKKYHEIQTDFSALPLKGKILGKTVEILSLSPEWMASIRLNWQNKTLVQIPRIQGVRLSDLQKVPGSYIKSCDIADWIIDKLSKAWIPITGFTGMWNPWILPLSKENIMIIWNNWEQEKIVITDLATSVKEFLKLLSR